MDYTPPELLAMDEAEARAELTDDEFAHWEKLVELDDQAGDTQERFEAEAEQVADLTVRADPEALGTRVTIFENDLLVRIDPEDESLLGNIKQLQTEYSDVGPGDVDALDATTTADLGDRMVDMLDAILVRWNGHDWAGIDDGTRQGVLDEIRSKWGVDGLLKAWGIIADAVEANREANMDVVESFQ